MNRLSFLSNLLCLFFLISPLSAKEWPPLVFTEAPPDLPLLRADKIRQEMAPFPVTKTGDTVRGIWHWHAGVDNVGDGHYVKISDLLTIQWNETSWVQDSVPGPGGVNVTCPLLVDVGTDGFRLGKKDVSVFFDVFGQGSPTPVQWVSSGENDAFLALDLNKNGIIDNGLELFGQGTMLIEANRKADNGYQALQQYDKSQLGGNEDGQITDADQVWEELVLWNDLNADGISEIDEIKKLSKEGIVSIDIKPRLSSKRRDRAGNLLPYWTWITVDRKRGPKKMKMADVFFVILD